MRFQCPFARLPRNRAVLSEVDAAAGRLYDKLADIEPTRLNISEYNQRYLRNQVQKLRGVIERCAFLLSWSLADNARPLEDFVFVDYGGGTGILAMLAKEFGIGKVLYSDIYDVSCRDAAVLAECVGLRAEHYVEGSIEELIRFSHDHHYSVDALACFGVIEHIYDIDDYLAKLGRLSNGGMTAVLASAANKHNPVSKWVFSRHHKRAEYQDRKRKWGQKERDHVEAFFTLRCKIISEHAPSLPDSEVSRLATATRGLIQDEIRACVDRYLESAELPKAPEHPTNTCDPYTGNWAERLMDTRELQTTLVRAGFAARVLSGYCWDFESSRIKSLAGSVLNLAIRMFGRQGLRLAPFYVLYARKETEPEESQNGST